MTAPDDDADAPIPLPLLLRAPHPDGAPLPPPAQLPSGVRHLRGVPYGELDGSRPLELDLWLPAAPAPSAPLVLFVHGGAWRRGRRDDMGLHTRQWTPGPLARIAETGFAVAAVDYRLSGEAVFPAPLEDLRTALRWLALRADELGVDVGRTVVWGESAGGHLTSLLTLTGSASESGTTRPEPGPDMPATGITASEPETTGPAPGTAVPATTTPEAAPMRPEAAVVLSGAVVWYGPSDFTTPRGYYSPHAAGTPDAWFLGAPAATVPALARTASPLAQVHPAAPPFLLVHGAADSMVPCSHSEDLAAALKGCGVRAELRLVPGADHGWHGVSQETVAEVFTYSLDFARALVGLTD
ncbi:alpha/beta hydrolase fold domain-containing protein (plasmid) [Streptomyces sp. CA-294286]|uniref:alpha/beta hydrolase fold domain-containing protein n=1 Tax=Streptomyces sp. CA-294286 TaxID=3240070 RepID=UPI003D9498AB